MIKFLTYHEINLFVDKAVAFANEMAAKAEYASSHLIPIVGQLYVCTVQQHGELFDACKDRAIRAENLVPLYLWSFPTAVDRKLTGMLMNFLKGIVRIRGACIDEGLAIMQFCQICTQQPQVGAQISTLPCGHAFHSHCISRLLEDDHLGPVCHSPAYDRYIAIGPPFMHSRPCHPARSLLSLST